MGVEKAAAAVEVVVEGGAITVGNKGTLLENALIPQQLDDMKKSEAFSFSRPFF